MNQTRRLRSCLVVLGVYALFISLGVAVRLELHQLGFIASTDQLAALRQALIVHITAALLVAFLLVFARIAKINHPLAPRLALAAMPFAMLVSVDTLVAIAFDPITLANGLHIPHPTRGWTSRPGWIRQGGRVAIRINSLGFRGAEIPKQRPPDERRILFLGDSVTLGSHAAEEDLFVTRVQELAAKRNGNTHIKIINASVEAYSPWQEHDLLINEGMRCDPDFIVQVFCLNDVMEKFQLERFGGYSRGFEPPMPARLEWSGIYRAARALRAGMIKPTNDELWRLRREFSPRRLLVDPDGPGVDEGWRMTFDNMTKIIATARAASLPMVIVCAPFEDQFSLLPPKGPAPQDVLAAFAQENGIPFLDLLPVFRNYIAKHGVQPSALFWDPIHFSAVGHDVAAVAIFNFLERLGWLD